VEGTFFQKKKPRARRAYGKRLAILVPILVILAAIFTGEWYLTQMIFSRSPIPRDAARQDKLDIFFITRNDQFTVNPATIQYDQSKHSLIYYVKPASSDNPIIVSQESSGRYATNDRAYKAFIDTLHVQTTFNTTFGAVYIAKPDQLNGDQALVLNDHGVVLFMRGGTEVTSKEWRDLIGKLYIIPNPQRLW
jgi:hypothetical protein